MTAPRYVTVGDVTELHLPTGQVAFIDTADLPLVQSIRWTIDIQSCALTYVRSTRAPGTRRVRLHQLILGKGGRIDHIDGNGLNNRRGNLRRASGQQNIANQRKTGSPTSSRFKGVTFTGRKLSAPWRAHITVNAKMRHLGYFDDEEKAALAYDRAASEHFGEFARLNFPAS